MLLSTKQLSTSRGPRKRAGRTLFAHESFPIAVFQRAFGLSARVTLEIDIRIPCIHIQQAREPILLCVSPSPCGLSCCKACHSSVHQTVQNYTSLSVYSLKWYLSGSTTLTLELLRLPSTLAFSLKYPVLKSYTSLSANPEKS